MSASCRQSTEPHAAAMNAIPKLVFTRSGKIDLDAIANAAPSQDLKDANANAEKKKLKRVSPAEAKKNAQSWLDPIIATDIVAELTRPEGAAGQALDRLRRGVVRARARQTGSGR
jgi:hypothetical protein